MACRTWWMLPLLMLGAMPGIAGESKHAHWTYSGKEGPTHWSRLEPAFATCGTGHQQSPVNVTHASAAKLPRIDFDYRPDGYRVINNGHAIQVDFKPGSHIRLDNTDFQLKQVHFHVPSEHTVEGRRFPMEAHLVHADTQGHLAVVAVLFKDGANNAWPKKMSRRRCRRTPAAQPTSPHPSTPQRCCPRTTTTTATAVRSRHRPVPNRCAGSCSSSRLPPARRKSRSYIAPLGRTTIDRCRRWVRGRSRASGAGFVYGTAWRDIRAAGVTAGSC